VIDRAAQIAEYAAYLLSDDWEWTGVGVSVRRNKTTGLVGVVISGDDFPSPLACSGEDARSLAAEMGRLARNGQDPFGVAVEFAEILREAAAVSDGARQ
jgi:hypothetical protein